MNYRWITILILFFFLISILGDNFVAFVQNYFMPLTKIRCKVINKLKLVEINGNSINNTDKRIKTEYVITFQTINGNKIRESISKNKYMNTNIGEYGFIKYKGVHYKGFVKVGVQ